MDTDEVRQILIRMAAELTLRARDIKTWRDYYDGDQPLKFATPEYKAQFGTQYEGFRDNWCAPTADAVPEKLEFLGLRLARTDDAAKRSADTEFARIWSVNEGQAESSMAWTESAVAKRAFAMVWGEGDDSRTPEITFEAGDEAIVSYEPGTRRRLYGLKMWPQDEHWTYGTLMTRAEYDDNGVLMTPAYLWKFQKRSSAFVSSLVLPSTVTWGGWEVREVPNEPWPLENPSGVIPLIELPNRPRLKGREPISEVAGVMAMQDAINTMWSYMFTAADFAAMPQRVLLGAAMPKIPVLDKDGQVVPGVFKTVEELLEPVLRRRLQAFQGDNAKIDQWDPADLEPFSKLIDFAVGHVAAQSRTPVDRFVTGQTIANVNEPGLKALNESHIAKVGETATYLSGGVREIAVVSYLMVDDQARADAARSATVEWEDFEARSDAAMGDKLLKWKQVGFSFPFIARQVIKDPVELAEEIERHDAELAAAAAAFDFGPKPDPNAADDSAAQ